eukprot:COSAG02_NODE_2512_length_8621_cov_278.639062_13_plen_108_part_00
MPSVTPRLCLKPSNVQCFCHGIQMDGRAWNSGYQVTVDGWQSSQWVKSIREVTRKFNEHGIQVSHSKVYQIQAQLDDLEAGRPNTRIRPLPKQAQFKPVGMRGERYL